MGHVEQEVAANSVSSSNSWRDIAISTYKAAGSDNLGMLAASIAFYVFLALVPMLGALVLAYGLIADPAEVGRHFHALFRLLPADAAKLLGTQMISITKASTGKTGLGLIFALVLALYGAMNGASSVVTALNMIHGEDEGRSWWSTILLAVSITVGLVLVGVIGLLAVGIVAFVEALFPGTSREGLVLLRAIFWLAAALATSGMIAATYRYAPNRPRPPWWLVMPGVVVTTAGWLLMTLAFGVYVANFAHYNVTYGALGAVVALQMWLYLSAYILMLGAELNSQVEDRFGHRPSPVDDGGRVNRYEP